MKNNYNPNKIEDVSCVYSGKANRYPCEDAGKFSYASAHRKMVGMYRGKPVKNSEIDDHAVKLVAKKVFNHPDTNHYGNHSVLETSRKIMILYYV